MNKIIYIAIVVVLLSSCTAKKQTQPLQKQTPTPTPEQLQKASPSPLPSENTASPSLNVLSLQKDLNMKKATLDTNFGKIVIEFYNDDAPKTADNFKKLASEGFYNKVIFHRVINGFMVQGGDPTGTGTGGPGYKFDDEIKKESALYKTGYKKGIVAMANSGPNTNGSQFFIMHKDYPLPPSYTIFAKVTEGQDVVDKIATTPTDSSDKPQKPVQINSIELSK